MQLSQLLSVLAVSATLITGHLSAEPPPARPGFVPADVRVRTDLDQG